MSNKDELFEMSTMLYDINEYEMMEDFAKTISDTRLQNQLYNSLNGKIHALILILLMFGINLEMKVIRQLQ